MKTVCYLRVAQTGRGYAFTATAKPSTTPLTTARGEALATRQIKLRLELPDDLFGPDATVELQVPAKLATVLVTPVVE